MDRRSIVLKIPFIGVATGVASLVLFAGAASAHTAQASVTRECAPERAESATIARVTIENNFDLAAVVTYSGVTSGSAPMVPNGSTAVTFTLTDPATLRYSVVWSDGFQQGERAVSVEPLTNCVIAPTTTTTTTPPTTTPTTTPPPTEATTVPPAAETVPPTTAPEATTAPTVLGAQLQPGAAPKAVPKSAAPAQLPATGTDGAVPLVAIGAGIVVAGALLLAVRRVPRSS
jgi:LPXTG-motif cell wall-anchored protein